MRRLLIAILLIAGCEKAPEFERKEAMAFDQVPPAILKMAKEKFPDVKFDTARKTSTGAIEVCGKAKTGKIHEVEVSPTGDIVETN
jgi:hypothetical protein